MIVFTRRAVSLASGLFTVGARVTLPTEGELDWEGLRQMPLAAAGDSVAGYLGRSRCWRPPVIGDGLPLHGAHPLSRRLMPFRSLLNFSPAPTTCRAWLLAAPEGSVGAALPRNKRHADDCHRTQNGGIRRRH